MNFPALESADEIDKIVNILMASVGVGKNSHSC